MERSNQEIVMALLFETSAHWFYLGLAIGQCDVPFWTVSCAQSGFVDYVLPTARCHIRMKEYLDV